MENAFDLVAARLDLERRAEHLATRFGGPPSDLSGIAGVVGITDIAVADIEAAARLNVGPVDGTWGVLLRIGDTRRRRRFSLAHEIAHLVLGVVGDERRYMGVVAARRKRGPIESTCDYFAGALLMPRSWTVAAISQVPVRQLADRFDVSSEAMRIRLRDLGYNYLASQLT